MKKTRPSVCLAALVAVAFSSGRARAEAIEVTPGGADADNIAKIEAAAAGDEVVVAPGTYRFRLYLAGQGTAGAPIVIRARDPGDRPIWNLSGAAIETFPGSHAGADAGSGIWVVSGSYYEISGISFQGGSDGAGKGGGVCLLSSGNVVLRDCAFEGNDNGITGSGADIRIEFCELGDNGFAGSEQGSHDLVASGDRIAVRYSYLHDAADGAGLVLRANEAVVEHNWIARSWASLVEIRPCATAPCRSEQKLLMRGNVLLGGSASGDAPVVLMAGDAAGDAVSLRLHAVANTVIGPGGGVAFVGLANTAATSGMLAAALDNNAVMGVARVFSCDDPLQSNWSADGTHNWVSEGVAGLEDLAATSTGADPMFRDLAGRDLVPLTESPLVGAAEAGVTDAPTKEYYRDEVVGMRWRWRTTARDVGAFESTTASAPVGPYDEPPPPPDGGVGDGDASAAQDAGDSGLIEQTLETSACSCRAPGAPEPRPGAGLIEVMARLLLVPCS